MEYTVGRDGILYDSLLSFVKSDEYKEALTQEQLVKMAYASKKVSDDDKANWEKYLESFVAMFNNRNILLNKEGEFKWSSSMAAGSLPPLGFDEGLWTLIRELGYEG